LGWVSLWQIRRDVFGLDEFCSVEVRFIMTNSHPDRWELVIPDYFPRSLNQTQDRHWVHRHKRKDRLIGLLSCLCIQKGGTPRFSGHVRMSITRLWGKRQRADLNISASVNPTRPQRHLPERAKTQLICLNSPHHNLP